MFHQKLLRSILNIRWLKKLKNEDLYNITKQEKWSITIKWRRLNWLGYMLRLHEDTPSRKLFAKAIRKTRKPVGCPKPTWPHLIRSNLWQAYIFLDYNNPDESLLKLTQMRHDRDGWRAKIKCIILQ